MPAPRHVYETFIRTTPERLWQALVDPELTRRYYYNTAFLGTVAAGEPYVYRGEDGNDAIDGTIVEAEPFRRLVMTFHVQYDPKAAEEQPSRVTWEITPFESVCKLTLVHDDLYGAPNTYAVTAGGWELIVSSLKSLVETGEPLPPVSEEHHDTEEDARLRELDVAFHRGLGSETNLQVWDLLDQAGSSPDVDDRLIHTAHASAYHWDQAGTDLNRARAHYLCSRVYAFVGRAEPALYHAQRCLDLTEANGFTDFDLAYAHEAMARALAAAGRLDEAGRHLEALQAVPVADEQDRSIVEGDVTAGPWFGLEHLAQLSQNV